MNCYTVETGDCTTLLSFTVKIKIEIVPNITIIRNLNEINALLKGTYCEIRLKKSS